MKRAFTLVAGILAASVLTIFAMILVFGFASTNFETKTVFDIVLLIVTSIMTVVTLVLNAMAIYTAFASHEDYDKKGTQLVATIVFNFVIALLFITELVGGVSVSAMMLFVMAFLAIVASNVFYILDFCLENKRFGAAIEKACKENPQDVYAQLERLGSLKERNILTEEEFALLKQNILPKQKIETPKPEQPKPPKQKKEQISTPVPEIEEEKPEKVKRIRSRLRKRQ